MFSFEIGRWVPKFILGDKNGYALAKAIESAMRAMNDAVLQGVKCVTDCKEMPEWRLDELAWEYNATWYNYDADIERKRAQIEGAMEYYNRLGTPEAVQRAIADVFGDGTVKEWFQYEGEPYHFRVHTTNTTILLENRARFMRLLDAVKNTRSVLDEVIYEGEARTTEWIATAVVGVCSNIVAVAE